MAQFYQFKAHGTYNIIINMQVWQVLCTYLEQNYAI